MTILRYFVTNSKYFVNSEIVLYLTVVVQRYFLYNFPLSFTFFC